MESSFLRTQVLKNDPNTHSPKKAKKIWVIINNRYSKLLG